MDDAVRSAKETLGLVESFYKSVDPVDFYRHSQNTKRLIDPFKRVTQLLVLPLEHLQGERYLLRTLQTSGHMVVDGLTNYHWLSHFIKLLNTHETALLKAIDELRQPQAISSSLPPAQEDLYPSIPGSPARQRWFWAIIRILRHVRKPLPQSIPNPLRRPKRLPIAQAFPPTYPKIFDYSLSHTPRLNTHRVHLTLSPSASARLMRLARSVNASIGAGCFTLIGLAMMALHEDQHPAIPPEDRLPYVAAFPLNPRAFFGYTSADSCMLAFSDGMALPFLPGSLPIDARFRVLARQADRQLKMYQKKKKKQNQKQDQKKQNQNQNQTQNQIAGEKGRKEEKTDDAAVGWLHAQSPLRLLATNFLITMERVEAKLPEHLKSGGADPQGAYPANWSPYGATNLVSSVGLVKEWVAPGGYPLDGDGDGDDGIAADFREVATGVRARENEFLVQSSGDGEVLRFAASYDANAIDEEMVERWKRKMLDLLEE
ncbi:hypothetical protein LTS18_006243 [Coniosporium uncinatum]|uniref:Uncharacterized protein n=1 Tax=Coniosporium uncinatum TaxID=93489 RepID=A0ACC3D3U9_9PEZI|nr:hypothetical protein LTS18_006243 [Coniosporium uncinatum]